MGACFVSFSLPGTLGLQQVKAKFADMQADDRYENGHSYSGGIGMATGLTYKLCRFKSVDEADEWLSDNAQKWEDALCVMVDGCDPPVWRIGAWCSS